MSREYTVTIQGVASPATAAFDLFELIPATGKPLEISRIWIGQSSEGVNEEEQRIFWISRGNTTGGSGGSAPTPAPLDPNDAAAGFTAETMNTTVATGGTEVMLVHGVWNTRAGLDLAFAPEERPKVDASGGTEDRLLVRDGGGADAITVRATVWVIEY